MILVTGATGTNGKELLSRLGDRSVRAMARRRPDDAKGAEWVQADFDDADSLRRACTGVERAFLVTNSSEHVLAQQLRFVQIAKESGVRHVVYLSQLHAKTGSPVRFLDYHGRVEDALAASGMTWTMLRPNLYMQGLLMFAPFIRKTKQLGAPAGTCKVSLVDVRDLADVAARALTDGKHAGQTYDLTGPAALTHEELATKLSSATGTKITYADVPERMMREVLLGAKMPVWQAEGLLEDYAHYRRGEAMDVSPAIRQITGHEPRSFDAFADEHENAFA